MNHAVALSLRRNPGGPNAKYVRAIILVKGVPFYGFHAAYQPYLKVLVSDPAHVSRIVTILQSGGIMGTKFTTYENHLNYYLQFMCDFGLYGCGWIDIGGELSIRQLDSRQDVAVNLVDFSFVTSPYYRQTRLPLELDICSHQIRNRYTIQPRDFHSSLGVPATPPSSQHLVHSVRELWEDERRRRAANGLDPSPDLPIILTNSRRGEGGDWVDLNRLENLLDERCESEKRAGKVYQQRNSVWEKLVLNTFDSVEALWEPSKRQRIVSRVEEQPENWSDMMIQEKMDTEQKEIDVDETLISSQNMEEVVEEDITIEGVNELQEPEHSDEETDDRDRQSAGYCIGFYLIALKLSIVISGNLNKSIILKLPLGSIRSMIII